MHPTTPAAFDMTIPAEIAAKLEPLHPDGAQHATAAALRLYLGLGKLGIDALQTRAKHEDMTASELVLHLLANPAPTAAPTPVGTMTPLERTPRSQGRPRVDNQDRDQRIAQEYFDGGVTYARLGAKYGLSTVRVTQIVTKARELQRI